VQGRFYSVLPVAIPIQRNIIREIKQLHARRAPLNISVVKRSHPKLIERVYAVRPFRGWKRALEDADLDYKKINVELRDYVDCKICGRDFGGLAYHLISQHQITPEDYRDEYPDAELLCETVRARISEPRSRKHKWYTLPRWEAIWTPEYVLDRMAELHRQNFPMNYEWASDHERMVALKAAKYFGSWDQALRRIDLDPEQIRLAPPTWPDRRPWWRADKAAILAKLHRRKAAREPRSLGKKSSTHAGMDPFHSRKSPWGKVNKTAVLAEIRRRKNARESVRSKPVSKEKWGQPLVRRASELFGSWNAALLAAGIEPEGGYSIWAKSGKAAILAELRRRKRARESLRVQKIAREKWGRALLVLSPREKTVPGQGRPKLPS
jgi:hypothetical protein